MSYEQWKDKIGSFRKVDVRHIQGNFFPGLYRRAAALEVGEGLEVVQAFRPHPLYPYMERLSFEHHTEQRGEGEFHVWFYRAERREASGGPSPMRCGCCCPWPTQ